MTTDLHKRLEKAAEKSALPFNNNGMGMEVCKEVHSFIQEYIHGIVKKAFLTGVEYGYKEAIEVAKEWLKESTYDKIIKGNFPDDLEEPDCCTVYVTQQRLLDDFEADMNKFWEEEK